MSQTAPAPVPGGTPHGRPRDPQLEQRVHAAVTVYADLGWSGFTLDAVARTARVGRAALYRRWSSKAALLVDALEACAPAVPDVDTGSVEGDLTALATHLLRSYTAPAGLVGLRAALDARTHPELLSELSATLNGSRLATARTVVTRAVARGELVAGTPPTLVVEAVAGAALSRVLFAPTGAGLSDEDVAASAARVVELVLRAYGRR